MELPSEPWLPDVTPHVEPPWRAQFLTSGLCALGRLESPRAAEEILPGRIPHPGSVPGRRATGKALVANSEAVSNDHLLT